MNIQTIGAAVYQCDRCQHSIRVEHDHDTTRKPTPADPLAQRTHEPPAGWVIASLQFVSGRPIIYGPHGGNALWCKDCGKDAELFAKNLPHN